MSKGLKVTKICPIAKRGQPWIKEVRIPLGTHAVDAYPDWAVARLIEKGHAELVEVEDEKPEPTPEELAALAAAKAEQEAMDAEVKAKAAASASAAKSQNDDKGGRGGGK